jgi:hypothetical protein
MQGDPSYSSRSVRFTSQLRRKVAEDVEKSPTDSSSTNIQRIVVTYPKEISLAQQMENYRREFGI